MTITTDKNICSSYQFPKEKDYTVNKLNFYLIHLMLSLLKSTITASSRI